MWTIKRDGERELVVNRSRFICALARVPDEPAAREFIATRRKRHWDAGHHCTAQVLGTDASLMRSSDDGEPSGTAGVPMLEVLRRRELTGVVAVVSRYFGGVKLGAGGLVRAYGSAVSQAIDEVGVAELRPMSVVTVTVAHTDAGRLEAELRRSRYPVRDVRYTEQVEVDVMVEPAGTEEFGAWLSDRTGGRGGWEVVEDVIVEVPEPD